MLHHKISLKSIPTTTTPKNYKKKIILFTGFVRLHALPSTVHTMKKKNKNKNKIKRTEYLLNTSLGRWQFLVAPHSVVVSSILSITSFFYSLFPFYLYMNYHKIWTHINHSHTRTAVVRVVVVGAVVQIRCMSISLF